MDDLRDGLAVVTGGGSGIGRSLCQVLSGEGMRVVVVDIEAGPADETVALLRDGPEAIAVRADVADPGSLRDLADRVKRALGPVQLLCNNAGVAPFRPLANGLLEGHDLPAANPADWEWTLAVNLMGAVNGVSAFLPQMLEQQAQTHIVNTSSLAGIAPCHTSPGLGIYAASNAAVIAYSEVLRTELMPHGIGVSILLPGTAGTTGITQSERNRHERFGGPVEPGPRRPPPPDQQLLEPIETARKIIGGIRANRLFIMADPTRRDVMANHFDHFLADVDASARETPRGL
jgi:NAD(P)-dependent dehydrogenase (short-subunit alcohol dehydrogenase family)